MSAIVVGIHFLSADGADLLFRHKTMVADMHIAINVHIHKENVVSTVVSGITQRPKEVMTVQLVVITWFAEITLPDSKDGIIVGLRGLTD